MSGEWKPGDVGIWSLGMRSELAFRVRHGSACAPHEGPRGRDDHWHLADGTWSDASASFVRPLVVIDPEDREQVERLASLYYEGITGRPVNEALLSQMQAALREYANPTPPKPDEPQGLGAVVEDDRGDVWVRNNPYDSCKWRSSDGTWIDYTDIDAVRVLSEGVTP